MSKNIIISHISDLDGRVSRELYIYYAGLPADTKTIWVEYGKRIADAESTISEWAKDRDVTILDFSITQKFLDRVAEVAKSVEVFDHHTGTQKLIAPDNATLIVDTRESTVSLLQKHFKGYETLFTNLCREIDINLIENPKVLAHKLYFDTIFFDEENHLQIELDKMFNDCTVPPFYEKKAQIHLTIASQAIADATIIINHKYKTVSLYKSKKYKGIDTDILASAILKYFNDFFALIYFDLPKENKRIFSVRKLKSNPRSLEEYCESRGGGGRETAGSFSTPLKEFSFCGGLK